MANQRLFLPLTIERKNQQFIHTVLSKMNDLYQLYAIIKKTS